MPHKELIIKIDNFLQKWNYSKYLQHKYPKERISPEERSTRYGLLRGVGLPAKEADRYKDWNRPTGIYHEGQNVWDQVKDKWPTGVKRPSSVAAKND